MKLVLGLGATGCAAIKFYQNQGHQVVAWQEQDPGPDIRHKWQQDYPNVQFYWQQLPPVTDIDEAMISPGINPRHCSLEPLVQQGLTFTSDIEIFARNAKAPIIAITGTNGKSTATKLVTNLLQAGNQRALTGGNYGPPALELLCLPAPDYYVLEVSSFQLEHCHRLPLAIACLLNITPDHITRHDSWSEYMQCKARIFQQTEQAVVSKQWQHLVPTNVHTVSYDDTDVGRSKLMDNGNIYYCGHKLLKMTDLSPALTGLHNLNNIKACLAIAKILQLPAKSCRQVLTSFTGLAHRCQHFATINGVKWLNDSKATNIAATKAAITAQQGFCHGKIILLLGGVSKNQDFTELAQVLAGSNTTIITFGRDGPIIARQLAMMENLHQAGSLEQAAKMAMMLAQNKDLVLLSPGGASFDAFSDFASRGQAFMHYVKQLSNRTVNHRH